MTDSEGPVFVYTARQLWWFEVAVFTEGALFGALIAIVALRFPQLSLFVAQMAAGTP